MSQTSFQNTKKRRSGYIRRFDLDELFDSDELSLKLRIAEHRILKAFDYAAYWSHGKMRGTDNFIVGVSPRQKDFVDYIIDNVVIKLNSGIVFVSELPSIGTERSSELRRIARDAECRLVASRLALMVRDGQIWFNQQIPGTWNVTQRAMDNYRLDRKLAYEANKVDQTLRRESLHGGGRLVEIH